MARLRATRVAASRAAALPAKATPARPAASLAPHGGGAPGRAGCGAAGGTKAAEPARRHSRRARRRRAGGSAAARACAAPTIVATVPVPCHVVDPARSCARPRTARVHRLVDDVPSPAAQAAGGPLTARSVERTRHRQQELGDRRFEARAVLGHALVGCPASSRPGSRSGSRSCTRTPRRASAPAAHRRRPVPGLPRPCCARR